ncbi:hypothetical protein N781_17545 [Pontibacillus halophilus JSM 076056 = DSM 19796]|uniref:histidine kinase n=1 Tax=Pontibacillus halophilus JSM 076056 = DSM 19796 TaxID=1385510 RepID=A0A0A5GG96_9BACI|nr:sensor histidine kinase [Pontibacillus halophilus]KGX92276.1 hypothetical protein N781_17545 [Pontibacillus halophilus JSM 076056 = DSM 19796]
MKIHLFPERFGKATLIWMVYFILPFLALFQLRGIDLVVGMVLFCLFIFLYIDNYWNPNHTMRNVVFMTGIIAFFVFRHHAGYLYTGMYTAQALIFLKSRGQFLLGYMLQIVLIAVLLFVHFTGIMVINLPYIQAAIIMILFTPVIINYQVKWEQSQQDLEEAYKRIDQLSKHEERERIGRDLHDSVGQTLSMITLKSDIAMRLVHTHPNQAENEMKEIHQISRTVLQQIREIVSDLKHLSYDTEIHEACNALSKIGIKVDYVGTTTVLQLNQLYENILAYCVKESITNLIRHSEATRCVIEKVESEKEVVVSISDNGVGFPKAFQKGNGLIGMEERLAMISGKVDLTHSDKQGCCVRISIPKVQMNQGVHEGVAQ